MALNATTGGVCPSDEDNTVHSVAAAVTKNGTTVT